MCTALHTEYGSLKRFVVLHFACCLLLNCFRTAHICLFYSLKISFNIAYKVHVEHWVEVSSKQNQQTKCKNKNRKNVFFFLHFNEICTNNLKIASQFNYLFLLLECSWFKSHVFHVIFFSSTPNNSSDPTTK